MKGSLAAPLVLLGVAGLSIAPIACQESDNTRPVTTTVYESVEQCLAENSQLTRYGEDPTGCRDNFETARARHTKLAPRYPSNQVCEQEYGEGQCEERPSPNQSREGITFIPRMSGYMMGAGFDGISHSIPPQPLYRPLVGDDGQLGTFRTAKNVDVGMGGQVSIRPSSVDGRVSDPHVGSIGRPYNPYSFSHGEVDVRTSTVSGRRSKRGRR